MRHDSSILVLTGPTASGKSSLALDVAEVAGGVIINADSMQVYRDFHVLTARPSLADVTRVEHRLYGTVDGSIACSMAMWAAMAKEAVEATWQAGKLPILVGGSGLYLRALMEGMAPVPEIPSDVRAQVRTLPEAERHMYLMAIDPVMAARLEAGDQQRILRAIEVMEATGQSLAEWQAIPAEPLLPGSVFHVFAVSRPREILYQRINDRFEEMLEAGVLDEAVAFKARELPDSLPIMRAHGAPELFAYLDGEMALKEATQQAQRNTRRYAKRQWTWLKHQLPQAQWIGPEDGDLVVKHIDANPQKR